ncbi:MAG TPA: CheR family methyltransferase [Gemmatimonadales bacterium]|nr:CheR family methyltransferase [Gemmatimonadales bacterium]
MGTVGQQAVEAILDGVGEWAGLALPADRRAGLTASIIRRLGAGGGLSTDARADSIIADEALLDQVMADLTVGESYFFRDPAQFHFIRDVVLPSLTQAHPQAPIRVWSAGCATGEEAYSLAILLREAGLAGHSHVIGTDIVRYRLAHARRARYTRWSLRGTSEQMERAYFQRQGSRFELGSTLRRSVVFRYLNLADTRFAQPGSEMAGMDLILCRNVLIYFSPRAVARVARALLDCLSDAGWLLLGGADPPLGSLVECETVLTGSGIAYRRKRKRSRHAGIVAEPAVPLSRSQTYAVPEPPRLAAPTSSLTRVPDDAPQAPAPASHEVPAPMPQALERVRMLADAGRFREAGLLCAAALERDPVCAELHYLHSLLLTDAGLFREAADAAARALYLDRALVPAHLALGCALIRIGEGERARRAFRNAEELLAAMSPSDEVPGSGGEAASRLAAFVRIQLQLIGDAA